MVDLLINIDVPDLAGAVRFYTEAFGFELGRRLGSSVQELVGGSSPVYLLEKAAGSAAAPGAAAPRRYERHWTPVHIDVVVSDLDAAVARAEAAGARLEAPVSEAAWGRLARLADPFGHGVCLIEFRGRGYDEIAERRGTTT